MSGLLSMTLQTTGRGRRRVPRSGCPNFDLSGRMYFAGQWIAGSGSRSELTITRRDGRKGIETFWAASITILH
jgi:hypothetical protein